MTEVTQYLQSKGVRPSMQRVAVMQYLMTHKTHPNVDEIFEALQPNMPTLSRTTVYSTLSLLCQCGAALLLDIDSKNKRYDGDTTLHAHFMCDVCGMVEDIRIADDQFIRACAPAGAAIRDVQLLYKGVCQNCRK